MKKGKKLSTIVITITILLALSVAVYAAITYFASDSKTSENTKGEYFEIELTTGMVSTELIPEASFIVEPVVKNEASVEIYAFIAVETPTVEDASIYEYTVSEEWILVESTTGKAVYAYATNDCMTAVSLDESTTKLTDQMTMKDISNAAFVGLDDINVTITGYGIGTEDVSTTPSEAWTYCKQVGNIE